MKGEILTPEHRLWGEFYRRLCGPEGCDFKFHAAKGYTWTCKGGSNKELAAAILRTLPEIDVEATLAYFEAQGHFCDCKIMFNATSSELDDELH